MSALTAMRRARGLTGFGLILTGAALLTAALAFFLFGLYGRAQLQALVVPAAGPALSLQELQRDLAPATPLPTATEGDGAEGAEPPPAGAPAAVAGPEEVDQVAPAQDALAAPPPGTGFDFRTLRAETTGAASGSLIGGQFQPVDWAKLSPTVERLPRASRIQIPAIGLDSKTVELNTKWEGASLVWETAVYAVGHHRGTPNPGEAGNSVFSGHISSPVSRQGAVFRRLPEVAALLKEGRTVDIILEAGDRRWLYRAFSTDVKEPDEVDVFRPATIPSLTLVTCVPDYIYSHRFLVNAVLVGVAAR